MPKLAQSILKAADQARQTLQTTQISQAGPGTILQDMQTLLTIVDRSGFVTKSRQGNLPPDALHEINRQLSDPIELPLTRPLLRDYPNIAGLYVLARVMGLIQPGSGRIRLNGDLMSLWDKFNPTEKYFTLVEAWLLFAEDQVLGGSAWTVYEQFLSNFRFLVESVTCRHWKTFPEWCHTSTWGISTWNVQLQSRLGLIETQPRRLQEREGTTRGWLLKKAKRTLWGEAVAWVIFEALTRDSEDEEYWFSSMLPEDAEYGFFQPAFAPYFPDWKRVFHQEDPICRSGTYIFKASLKTRAHEQVWRELAVPSDSSLEDLAYGVLKAFGFYDFDHMYEFRFSDSLGKLRKYYHPYCDQGPYAWELSVGETGLRPSQSIRFRFDFGDDWRFMLSLKRIDPPIADGEIQVRASEGNAPPQYPIQSE